MFTQRLSNPTSWSQHGCPVYRVSIQDPEVEETGWLLADWCADFA
ncbi:hypothetical protein HMPREF3198_00963 [Winkia neuii]|nr:hypothetical protein HMPREF3198_00963 [Winkia neuii]